MAPDYSVTQLKGIKEMNFGSFEAQPEHLLPKHRPGSRSFEDLLVPYGGEDIREVGQRVLKTVLEKAEAHTKDGAENLLFVSHGAALWGLIISWTWPFLKEWALEIVMFVFMIITKVNWSFSR